VFDTLFVSFVDIALNIYPRVHIFDDNYDKKQQQTNTQTNKQTKEVLFSNKNRVIYPT